MSAPLQKEWKGLAMTVYDAIRAERSRQDAKWGGPTHDDLHTLEEWAGFIGERVDLVRDAQRSDLPQSVGRDGARKALVEIAALAVAAVEALDRVGDEVRD